MSTNERLDIMTYSFKRTEWLSAIARIDPELLESKNINFTDLYAYASVWADTRQYPAWICEFLRIPFQPTGQRIWAFLKNQKFVVKDEPNLPFEARFAVKCDPTLPDRVVF